MATYYFRNTGDVNWGTASNWSLTDGGGATGAVPTSADDAYFTSNSGNCTVNGTLRVCKTLVFSGVGAGNYAGTLTMTNNITVSGNITLSATMTIAGASILTLDADGSLNFNGKTWPNAFTILNTSGTKTTTLLSDITINGLFTLFYSAAYTFNGTFSINLNGGTAGSGTYTQGTGTTTLNLKGGTWSSNTIRINTNLDGNVTISGTVGFNTAILTYLSGTITTSGSTLSTTGNATINTSGMGTTTNAWNNVTITANLGNSTLTSDLYCTGTLLLSTPAAVINGNNIYCSGSLTVSSGGTSTGTTNIILNGTGIFSNTTGTLRNNLTINTSGTITISGTINYNTGTLTYTAGIVKANTATLNIAANTTFVNCDKINFKIISITAGATITMNKFFSGSATTPTRIQSSSTTSNYTITFQDGFEKITKFTRISNCTLSRPGQLLCLTNNSNKGGNVGVRYINQIPDGFAKNSPSIPNTMTNYIASISDPVFQTLL